MVKKSKSSLKEIVGNKVYSIWVDMLHRLVPDGRTHRLAPTIASMLQYALDVAYEKYGNEPEEETIAYSLLIAQETDSANAIKLLLPIVEELCKDAHVKSKRRSVKGIDYSIAEASIQEFIHWYEMPWES